MSFVILFSGIVILILLISWFKLNAFLAFLLVSMGIGFANGMPVAAITDSMQKGLGDLVGSLIIILVVGAMLGKLIADQGAAQRIVSTLMNKFGRRYMVWALVITAFIVGIPLFYGIGFVLMVPLVITLSYKYDIPAVYIGLPMLAALSVTHGYLPPHPSPVALVKQYHADLGLTLLYGLVAAIPAVIIAGPVFSLSLKKYKQKPLATFAGKPMEESELPGLADSLIAALLPVFLIAVATVIRLSGIGENGLTRFLLALGDPVVALLLTLLYGIYALVLKRGKKLGPCMVSLGEAAKDISVILLIIAGAGALNQVLTDSGTGRQIAAAAQGFHRYPIIAAWGIAAFIRVCLGSATVAGLTAAGIMAPMVAGSGVNPSLVVLATGAGSLMFSHVNDGGFWMFKEYFNLSIRDTIKTWSLMETIVSIVGLLAVLGLSLVITH
ncbi:MAG TPA: gluconate:H+ symporter [Puia sp.]|nr:gluconate:H+ symporter [Puia sp.]